MPQPKSTKASAASAPQLATVAPNGKTKIALVIELLERESGASMAELQSATSWQAHSVRGALSGLICKAKGRPVTSHIVDGQRRYRLEAKA